MDDKQFSMLQERLDKISRLMAIIALKDIEQESDKIVLLDSLGFRPSEIAKLLSKSLSNVTVVLSKIRKRAKPEGITENQSSIDKTGDIADHSSPESSHMQKGQSQ